jgi:hypothetical protein
MGLLWHCGVASRKTWTPPGPLKPRVVSGTDLQSVPAKSLQDGRPGGFRVPGSAEGRHPHRGSTGETVKESESSVCPTPDSRAAQAGAEGLPLAASERPGRSGVESERFPLTASDRLYNPS